MLKICIKKIFYLIKKLTEISKNQIGGVDISFCKAIENIAVSYLVVLSYPDLNVNKESNNNQFFIHRLYMKIVRLCVLIWNMCQGSWHSVRQGTSSNCLSVCSTLGQILHHRSFSWMAMVFCIRMLVGLRLI